jgi:iron complex transport system substrate-binding protein
MGTTNICGQPQRIVVLGPYLLEPLLALNVQPIGYADHITFHQGSYTNPSQQIPYLGDRISQPLANVGIAYTPSIEAILNAKPDLILGTAANNTRQYQTLSKIAPTLIFGLNEPQTTLKTIAQAVDRPQEAKQLLSETTQRINNARQEFASFVATTPKLLLLSSTEPQQFRLDNDNHGLCSSLLKELGFELVDVPGIQKPQPSALVPVSVETLPDLNQADHIVLLGSDFTRLNGKTDFEDHQLANLKQAWEKNAIAQNLNASKNGRVYFIPAYLCLGLPGPIGTELYLNELKKQLLSPLHH